MNGLGLNLNKNGLYRQLPCPLEIYKNNIKLGFSYFRLFKGYTGYCLRVRRSSDNAEQDFGFIGNYINITGIVDFCGSGNGYVTIWYNQFATGNNAIQTTAVNQPQIVSNGVFETNGVKFVAANSSYLGLSSYAAINFTTTPVSIYINYVLSNNDPGVIIYKNTNLGYVQFGLIITENANFRIDTDAGVNMLSHATGLEVRKSLYTWSNKNADGLSGNQNNVILTATQATDITAGDIVTLGIRYLFDNASVPLQGHIKSFVMANTDLNYEIAKMV